MKKKRIRKTGQYIANLSHFKVLKNAPKQRYGVATVQIVYAAAYELYEFSLLSEFFKVRLHWSASASFTASAF